MPLGRAVRIRLRSKDVIHSFFLPNFRVKQDAVPGMTPEVVFFPTKKGTFEIACAELCGLAHYRMRGFFNVVSPAGIRPVAAQTAGVAMTWTVLEQPGAVHPGLGTTAHGHDDRGFIRRYVFSTDHKVIGIQYIFTGLVMALVGGGLAALIRLQLGWPDQQWPLLGRLLPAGYMSGVMTPEFYLAVVTMHGTIMVFFFISYVLVSGFGNYLVPLQVGAHDMAFPFLNMLSYWVALLSAIVCSRRSSSRAGPRRPGWTAYPPLSAVASAVPGSQNGQTIWILSMALFIASFTMSGLNIVATVFSVRAPGMSMMRLPLTVWSYFIASILGCWHSRR